MSECPLSKGQEITIVGENVQKKNTTFCNLGVNVNWYTAHHYEKQYAAAAKSL